MYAYNELYAESEKLGCVCPGLKVVGVAQKPKIKMANWAIAVKSGNLNRMF